MPASVAQQRFDPAEIRLVIKIRRDDFDRPAGLVRETLCQAVEAPTVAPHASKKVAKFTA
jgi:hypothetical protein